MKHPLIKAGMKMRCVGKRLHVPFGEVVTVREIDGCIFRSEEYGNYAHDEEHYEPLIVEFNNKDQTPFCSLTVEEKKVLVNAFIEGRSVEYLRHGTKDRWYGKESATTVHFMRDEVYRIKPVKTERQIKIEELETQMAAMQSKIDELKQLED